jgi:hypothetical protein
VLHDYTSADATVINSRFSGLYLAYNTLSSVNMPYTLARCLNSHTYHVGSLQSQTALHQTDNLVKVAVSLVEREQRRQLFRMYLLVSATRQVNLQSS